MEKPYFYFSIELSFSILFPIIAFPIQFISVCFYPSSYVHTKHKLIFIGSIETGKYENLCFYLTRQAGKLY